jgi:Zn-dependent M28 family amino/carboxypeptidase
MGRSEVEGWITLDRAKALFKMAGQDFDSLKAKAATNEFAPMPLGVTASISLKNNLRTVESQNLVALLEGSDPVLRREVVVYNAHWDHFGVGAKVNGDSIYNGASDNATGVAGILAIARAFTASKTAPKRSILFLSVTSEEQGLLGSQYYAMNPLYPLARTLAIINLDGLNSWGKTSDIVVMGYGASDLDDYARVAAAEQGGRTLRPDVEPEKGYYYRSDHFNFAKVGVPAFYPGAGITYVGKDPSYGMTKRAEFVANDYHKPSDEIKPEWDLTGAVQDMQFDFAIGYRVANAGKIPEWKPGNEFKAIRDQSLKPKE